MLSTATNECGEDWDLEIPFVQFNYMNQDHNDTGYLPFYLSHGYLPRTPRLVISPSPPTKHQSTMHQWASTLASRFKDTHSGALARDSRQKQRRVAGCTEDSAPLQVGDTVMMHFPPRPGFPSKLQSRWQGPFIVVKCLQGNTYRIKLASNFRKRFVRHSDQLRVLHTRPARLHPTQSDNTMGQPTGAPCTVSPEQATAVPSLPHQTENSAEQGGILTEEQQTMASAPRRANTAMPAKPPATPEDPPSNAESREEEEDRSTDRECLSSSEPCAKPHSEICRETRVHRPPDRYGD